MSTPVVSTVASFPQRIDCQTSDVDNLCEWAAARAPLLDEALLRNGAVLFANSGIRTPTQFEQLVRAIAGEKLTEYSEESSPRSRIAGKVFSSTDYPASYPIQFHNEFSYAARWPGRLYFCCFQAAEAGGETPISDTRRVLANMSASTRRAFEEKGVLYIRNYRPHIGVSWQKAFGTDSRGDVEAACVAAGISYEWRAGDVLQTRQRTEAIVIHPQAGEPVWFNHAFHFNVHAVEPLTVRELVTSYPADDPLSTNSLFGDGTPLDPAIVEELRSLYAQASSAAPWQVGDVLMIDNMLTAHARASFRGQRSVGVLMSHPRDRARMPSPAVLAIAS